MPHAIGAANNAASLLVTQRAEHALREDTVRPAEISDHTRALIVSTLAAGVLAHSDGTGKAQGHNPVDFRAPEYTPEQANALFFAGLAKAERLLAAINGSQDPAANEEGAAHRLTEAVAAGIPASAEPSRHQSVPSEAPQDILDPAPEMGVWLTSDKLVSLMVALREAIQELERQNIEHAGRMRTIQLDAARSGAQKGVDAAEVNIMAAAVGAFVATGFGAVAMSQQYKSTTRQTDSMKLNQNEAQLSSQRVHDVRGAFKANTAPTAELRPARGLDGTPVANTSTTGQPAAAVQADVDVDRSAMRAIANSNTERPVAETLQNLHGLATVDAQRYMHHAMMLQVMGPGLSNTASAAFGVEEKTLLGQQEIARTDVQNFGATASESEDQLRSDRSLRDSATQVAEALLERRASTANQIISNI